eukprot:scaffold95002_cov19-Tisochrysis_lutea.AAC.1
MFNLRLKTKCLHIQNAQEASRRVKKEQSNFKVQARCRFRPRFYSYFIDTKMSGACRNVAKRHNTVSAIFGTPRGCLTPDGRDGGAWLTPFLPGTEEP